MKFKFLSILIVLSVFINLFTFIPALSAEIAWPTEFNLQGKEMPFRPIDKYVTEQNPPDFSWPSVANANFYELKVCSDIKLKNTVYHQTNIKDNFYNFDKTFEINVYYWAVRFYSNSGVSQWSDARRFRIDPNATNFPVESLETLMQKISKSHPRIWTNENDLDKFRETAKTPLGKEYLNKITKEVQASIENPPKLELNPSDYKNSDDLFYKLRLGDVANILNPIMKGALIYLLTEDEKMGKYAVSLLVAMSKWDPEGVTSYKSQDQVHREIAYMGAMAYDWLCDLMTEEEKTIVIDMVRTRTKTMADDLINAKVSIKDRPYESHGWTAFGYIMVIALATIDEIPESKSWLEFVLPTYINVLPPWGNEDGGWSQGTYYYSVSSPTFQRDILKRAGIIDLNNKAWSKNEMLFPIYQNPAGSVGAFGDSSYQVQNKFTLYNYAKFATAYNSGISKWAQEELGDISVADTINDGNVPVMTYLLIADKYNEIKSEMPLTLPLAKRFKDIGWSSMHSDLIDQNRISLFFKSSPFGSFNHSHADQNSFVIQAFGERLAIDSGYYAYGTNWENKYVRQTFAHNGITINGGKGQTINSFTAKGSLDQFITHPDFDMVRGDATTAYDGILKKAVRNIIYVRPDTFIVIDDLEAANDKGSNFEFWLNGMDNSINVYESGNGARINKGVAALDAKIQYPKKINYKYSNIFSGADLVEVPTTDAYKSSEVQERIWFETEKLPKTKIVTTMDVHKSDSNAQMIETKDYDNYIEISFENGVKAYVNTTGASEVIANDIKFSGDAVILNESSIMLVSGTSLELAGKSLVKSDKNISTAIGRGLINISTSDDANVEIAYDNVKEIKDQLGRELNEKIGVSYKNEDNLLKLKLQMGDYNFAVNNASHTSKKVTDQVVKININGNTIDEKVEGKKSLTGDITLYGKLKNKSGFYKLVDQSAGMNLDNAKIGEVVYLSENTKFVSYNDENPYITLKEVEFTNYETEPNDDHQSLKESCDVVFEAEDFIEKTGKTTKYTSRKFLSGGAGVSTLDTTDDSATYKFDIQESGNYDMVIKYVAWNNGTQRQFILDSNTGMFTCPTTLGWGAVESEWKAMTIKNNLYLEKGAHTLKLNGLNYNWNIDWIGFVKK